MKKKAQNFSIGMKINNKKNEKHSYIILILYWFSTRFHSVVNQNSTGKTMLPDPLFESFSLHHQNEHTDGNKNLNNGCIIFYSIFFPKQNVAYVLCKSSFKSSLYWKLILRFKSVCIMFYAFNKKDIYAS